MLQKECQYLLCIKSNQTYPSLNGYYFHRHQIKDTCKVESFHSLQLELESFRVAQCNIYVCSLEFSTSSLVSLSYFPSHFLADPLGSAPQLNCVLIFPFTLTHHIPKLPLNTCTGCPKSQMSRMCVALLSVFWSSDLFLVTYCKGNE